MDSRFVCNGNRNVIILFLVWTLGKKYSELKRLYCRTFYPSQWWWTIYVALSIFPLEILPSWNPKPSSTFCIISLVAWKKNRPWSPLPWNSLLRYLTSISHSPQNNQLAPFKKKRWLFGILSVPVGYIWVLPKIVGFPPKSSIFNRVFHFKPIHFGVFPYFWKHPYITTPVFPYPKKPTPRHRCRCYSRWCSWWSSRWSIRSWFTQPWKLPTLGFFFRIYWRSTLGISFL